MAPPRSDIVRVSLHPPRDGIWCSIAAADTPATTTRAHPPARMELPSEDAVLEPSAPPSLDVPPHDDRRYRLVTLANGLRVLLATDATAEHGAAALSVDVGAAHDPADFPGLAHFCEHMLFLGSAKYPEESAYKKFLAAHGGRANASTSMEATTYHFEVLQPHLAGALDIFAQFFIEPLFTESATGRELQAVDAEDARNRTNDSRRVLQVLKAAADAPSPWRKFSTGNSETLQGGGAATRAALLGFHARHYYGARMALALLGAAPLDELEALVRASFAPVATHPRSRAGNQAERHAAAAAAAAAAAGGAPVMALSAASVACPYGSASLPRLIHVAPLRELRELSVLFPAPPVRAHYRADPSRLCSHLLGHEAEGSALAALQDRGWATALSAGLRVDDRQFCVFQVKVTLSAEGEARWREVVGVVEEHCACVRGMSDEETARHWAEIAELAALDFEFMEKASPQGWATSHARRLRLFAPEHALSAGHLFDATLDLAATRAWLAHLDVNNALVLMACQQPPLCLSADPLAEVCEPLAPPWAALAGAPPHAQAAGCCKPGSGAHTASERYYGVPYTCSPLPPLPASATPAGLQLPPRSSFIPRDRSLRAGSVLVGLEVPPPPPTLLAADARGELWHALDARYALPRAELRLHLAARPLSRVERTLASLHAALLTQLLKRRTYDAEVAGLSSSLVIGARGASVRVSGFSQHAPRLLATVAEALLQGAADAPIAATCFELVRERMERRLRSRRVESPASQAVHWQELLLGAGERVGIDAEIADVRAATLDSLRAFHADWRRALFAATLAIGNVTAEEARGCHRELLALLARYGSAPLPPGLRATTARGRLPSGAQLELHSAVGSEAEKNSCAHVLLQAGALGEEAQACLRVLASVIKEPCFRELRTKQQVGYSVSASHDISLVHVDGGEAPLRVEGLVVCATSKSLGAAEVLVRIDQFLAAFRAGALTSLDESTVRDHAEALATRLLAPPKRLATESDEWWAQIRDRRLDFDVRARLATALRRVTPAGVRAMFDRMLTCRLSSLVYGTTHPLRAQAAEAGSGLPPPVLATGVTTEPTAHASLPRWARSDACGRARPWWTRAVVGVALAAAAVVVVARLRRGARLRL